MQSLQNCETMRTTKGVDVKPNINIIWKAVRTPTDLAAMVSAFPSQRRKCDQISDSADVLQGQYEPHQKTTNAGS